MSWCCKSAVTCACPISRGKGGAKKWFVSAAQTVLSADVYVVGMAKARQFGCVPEGCAAGNAAGAGLWGLVLGVSVLCCARTLSHTCTVACNCRCFQLAVWWWVCFVNAR